MNTGKVSNSILKRSVLKLIKKNRKEVICGASIGADSAIIHMPEGCNAALSSSNARYGIYRITNNLAAVNARSVAVMANIILPEESEESTLKAVVRELQEQCTNLNVQISGGHTEVSKSVSKPLVSLTGIGYSDSTCSVLSKNIRPCQDIIMTKWIGIEGTRIIAELKKEEILKVYTESFLEKAVGNELDMSVAKEAFLAAENGVTAMHDIAEGGVFGALWDFAEAGRVGLTIDFRKIPVKQEIIEICEIFDINPYEMASSGALLMTSDDGYDIVKLLKENGINAAVIGRTTAGNDRIIINEDETRYLDPPKRDEIHTFI